jgi:hypothetical protein
MGRAIYGPDGNPIQEAEHIKDQRRVRVVGDFKGHTVDPEMTDADVMRLVLSELQQARDAFINLHDRVTILEQLFGIAPIDGLVSGEPCDDDLDASIDMNGKAFLLGATLSWTILGTTRRGEVWRILGGQCYIYADPDHTGSFVVPASMCEVV